LSFVWSREFNVPEIRPWIDNGDSVEKTSWVLVDFGDDTGPGDLPIVALSLATQGDLLAGKEPFREADDGAVATHQEGFGGLLDLDPAVAVPRSFHGHTKADAVALPKSFRAHNLFSIEG
jgi:hypothetical protein